MKEIKTTIIGIILILIGSFVLYSKGDTAKAEYIYSSLGIVVIGVYSVFSDTSMRKRHIKFIFDSLKKYILKK